MTLKVFTDPAMTRDALPGLRVGDQVQEVIDGHLFVVTATREVGCDTGRRRYRVVCRTCRLVAHPATTGPRHMMDSHVRRMVEDGHDATFPGTSIGVEE